MCNINFQEFFIKFSLIGLFLSLPISFGAVNFFYYFSLLLILFNLFSKQSLNILFYNKVSVISLFLFVTYLISFFYTNASHSEYFKFLTRYSKILGFVFLLPFFSN